MHLHITGGGIYLGGVDDMRGSPQAFAFSPLVARIVQAAANRKEVLTHLHVESIPSKRKPLGGYDRATMRDVMAKLRAGGNISVHEGDFVFITTLQELGELPELNIAE